MEGDYPEVAGGFVGGPTHGQVLPHRRYSTSLRRLAAGTWMTTHTETCRLPRGNRIRS